ncbi:MAG: D-alanine--D-alanine ligase [Rickettsiales bacterium]|nr:D-alanine--D-alanine ligase [Rickettsiales bacterium]
MGLHVVALLGGMSKERDVSLESGKCVINALNRLGYRVTPVDPGKDLAEVLSNLKPDVVFNALHGTYGEDGSVQGVLELLGLPYTHSGILASATAFYKPFAKQLFENFGVQCPSGMVMNVETLFAQLEKGHDPLPRPYVIKPPSEGSSIGVFIVDESTDTSLIHNEWSYGREALVEEFIPGKELSVAVLAEQPLGIMEICPKEGFYDYKNKYTDGMADHIVPAEIDADIYQKAMDAALKGHRALHCRGVSRADFRFDDTKGIDGLFLMEINTHPGMTDLSIVPEIAAAVGISFEQLVDILVKDALEFHKSNQPFQYHVRDEKEQQKETV